MTEWAVSALGHHVVAWWPTAGAQASGRIQGGRGGLKNWPVAQSLLFPCLVRPRQESEKSLLLACSPLVHLSIDCVLSCVGFVPCCTRFSCCFVFLCVLIGGGFPHSHFTFVVRAALVAVAFPPARSPTRPGCSCASPDPSTVTVLPVMSCITTQWSLERAHVSACESVSILMCW